MTWITSLPSMKWNAIFTNIKYICKMKIVRGGLGIRCGHEGNSFSARTAKLFSVWGWKQVIYVENTYLHSNFFHAACTRMFARIIIYGLDMQWFLSTPPCSVNCKHFSPLESSRDVNIFLCASKFTFWLDGQRAEEPEICYSRQICKTPTWKGQTWEKGTWKGAREEKSSGASKEIKLFLNKTGEFMTFCESPIHGT